MPKDSVAVLKLLNSALYDYYEILLNKTRLTDLLSVPKFKLRDVESCVWAGMTPLRSSAFAPWKEKKN